MTPAERNLLRAAQLEAKRRREYRPERQMPSAGALAGHWDHHMPRCEQLCPGRECAFERGSQHCLTWLTHGLVLGVDECPGCGEVYEEQRERPGSVCYRCGRPMQTRCCDPLRDPDRQPDAAPCQEFVQPTAWRSAQGVEWYPPSAACPECESGVRAERHSDARVGVETVELRERYIEVEGQIRGRSEDKPWVLIYFRGIGEQWMPFEDIAWPPHDELVVGDRGPVHIPHWYPAKWEREAARRRERR